MEELKNKEDDGLVKWDLPYRYEIKKSGEDLMVIIYSIPKNKRLEVFEGIVVSRPIFKKEKREEIRKKLEREGINYQLKGLGKRSYFMINVRNGEYNKVKEILENEKAFPNISKAKAYKAIYPLYFDREKKKRPSIEEFLEIIDELPLIGIDIENTFNQKKEENNNIIYSASIIKKEKDKVWGEVLTIFPTRQEKLNIELNGNKYEIGIKSFTNGDWHEREKNLVERIREIYSNEEGIIVGHNFSTDIVKIDEKLPKRIGKTRRGAFFKSTILDNIVLDLVFQDLVNLGSNKLDIMMKELGIKKTMGHLEREEIVGELLERKCLERKEDEEKVRKILEYNVVDVLGNLLIAEKWKKHFFTYLYLFDIDYSSFVSSTHTNIINYLEEISLRKGFSLEEIDKKPASEIKGFNIKVNGKSKHFYGDDAYLFLPLFNTYILKEFTRELTKDIRPFLREVWKEEDNIGKIFWGNLFEKLNELIYHHIPKIDPDKELSKDDMKKLSKLEKLLFKIGLTERYSKDYSNAKALISHVNKKTIELSQQIINIQDYIICQGEKYFVFKDIVKEMLDKGIFFKGKKVVCYKKDGKYKIAALIDGNITVFDGIRYANKWRRSHFEQRVFNEALNILLEKEKDEAIEEVLTLFEHTREAINSPGKMDPNEFIMTIKRVGPLPYSINKNIKKVINEMAKEGKIGTGQPFRYVYVIEKKGSAPENSKQNKENIRKKQLRQSMNPTQVGELIQYVYPELLKEIDINYNQYLERFNEFIKPLEELIKEDLIIHDLLVSSEEEIS